MTKEDNRKTVREKAEKITEDLLFSGNFSFEGSIAVISVVLKQLVVARCSDIFIDGHPYKVALRLIEEVQRAFQESFEELKENEELKKKFKDPLATLKRDFEEMKRKEPEHAVEITRRYEEIKKKWEENKNG